MKKVFKTFIIDNRPMRFNSVSFERFFKAKQKKLGISVLDYEFELGEKLSVTNHAIHNWRFNSNGPSDIASIKLLADYLDISDYKLLLQKGDEKIMKISERQKDSLKRIYDAIIDYLDKFEKTNGFNDLWFDFDDENVSSNYIENRLYDIAENELRKIDLIIKKEYIELYKLPIYDQLREYVWEDLCDTYNDKLSYAYRFEAPVLKKRWNP